MLPEPRQKPTLFGDFSRLTLAILNQTGAYQNRRKRQPYRSSLPSALQPCGVVSCRMYFIGRVRYFLSRIRLVEVLPDTTFEIDNTLISLIEQSDFMEALPHMNIIHQIMHYGSKQTNNRN